MSRPSSAPSTVLDLRSLPPEVLNHPGLSLRDLLSAADGTLRVDTTGVEKQLEKEKTAAATKLGTRRRVGTETAILWSSVSDGWSSANLSLFFASVAPVCESKTLHQLYNHLTSDVAAARTTEVSANGGVDDEDLLGLYEDLLEKETVRLQKVSMWRRIEDIWREERTLLLRVEEVINGDGHSSRLSTAVRISSNNPTHSNNPQKKSRIAERTWREWHRAYRSEVDNDFTPSSHASSLDGGLELPQYVEQITSCGLNGRQFLSFHPQLAPLSTNAHNESSASHKTTTKRLEHWTWEHPLHAVIAAKAAEDLRQQAFTRATLEMIAPAPPRPDEEVLCSLIEKSLTVKSTETSSLPSKGSNQRKKKGASKKPVGYGIVDISTWQPIHVARWLAGIFNGNSQADGGSTEESFHSVVYTSLRFGWGFSALKQFAVVQASDLAPSSERRGKVITRELPTGAATCSPDVLERIAQEARTLFSLLRPDIVVLTNGAVSAPQMLPTKTKPDRQTTSIRGRLAASAGVSKNQPCEMVSPERHAATELTSSILSRATSPERCKAIDFVDTVLPLSARERPHSAPLQSNSDFLVTNDTNNHDEVQLKVKSTTPELLTTHIHIHTAASHIPPPRRKSRTSSTSSKAIASSVSAANQAAEAAAQAAAAAIASNHAINSAMSQASTVADSRAAVLEDKLRVLAEAAVQQTAITHQLAEALAALQSNIQQSGHLSNSVVDPLLVKVNDSDSSSMKKINVPLNTPPKHLPAIENIENELIKTDDLLLDTEEEVTPHTGNIPLADVQLPSLNSLLQKHSAASPSKLVSRLLAATTTAPSQDSKNTAPSTVNGSRNGKKDFAAIARNEVFSLVAAWLNTAKFYTCAALRYRATSKTSSKTSGLTNNVSGIPEMEGKDNIRVEEDIADTLVADALVEEAEDGTTEEWATIPTETRAATLVSAIRWQRLGRTLLSASLQPPPNASIDSTSHQRYLCIVALRKCAYSLWQEIVRDAISSSNVSQSYPLSSAAEGTLMVFVLALISRFLAKTDTDTARYALAESRWKSATDAELISVADALRGISDGEITCLSFTSPMYALTRTSLRRFLATQLAIAPPWAAFDSLFNRLDRQKGGGVSAKDLIASFLMVSPLSEMLPTLIPVRKANSDRSTKKSSQKESDQKCLLSLLTSHTVNTPNSFSVNVLISTPLITSIVLFLAAERFLGCNGSRTSKSTQSLPLPEDAFWSALLSQNSSSVASFARFLRNGSSNTTGRTSSGITDVSKASRRAEVALFLGDVLYALCRPALELLPDRPADSFSTVLRLIKVSKDNENTELPKESESSHEERWMQLSSLSAALFGMNTINEASQLGTSGRLSRRSENAAISALIERPYEVCAAVARGLCIFGDSSINSSLPGDKNTTSINTSGGDCEDALSSLSSLLKLVTICRLRVNSTWSPLSLPSHLEEWTRGLTAWEHANQQMTPFKELAAKSSLILRHSSSEHLANGNEEAASHEILLGELLGFPLLNWPTLLNPIPPKKSTTQSSLWTQDNYWAPLHRLFSHVDGILLALRMSSNTNTSSSRYQSSVADDQASNAPALLALQRSLHAELWPDNPLPPEDKKENPVDTREKISSDRNTVPPQWIAGDLSGDRVVVESFLSQLHTTAARRKRILVALVGLWESTKQLAQRYGLSLTSTSAEPSLLSDLLPLHRRDDDLTRQLTAVDPDLYSTQSIPGSLSCHSIREQTILLHDTLRKDPNEWTTSTPNQSMKVTQLKRRMARVYRRMDAGAFSSDEELCIAIESSHALEARLVSSEEDALRLCARILRVLAQLPDT